jgi:hypothetical protein
MDELINVTVDAGFNGDLTLYRSDSNSLHLALQAAIVTIVELKRFIQEGSNDDAFVVQCYLTQFDLDGSLNQIVSKRWSVFLPPQHSDRSYFRLLELQFILQSFPSQ